MDEDEGMQIGYARVSTEEQEVRLQIEALKRYGIPESHIRWEKASGASMDRRVLRSLLLTMPPGSTLVVWKLDRFGRTVAGILEALDEMKERGIRLKSVTESLDTSTAMGMAFLQFVAIFAELERNMISERTSRGMQALKDAGKKFGRGHSIIDNPKRMAAARAAFDSGELQEMSAKQMVEFFNKADRKAAPIKALETPRRWRREGYKGLFDEPEEAPLALDDRA